MTKFFNLLGKKKSSTEVVEASQQFSLNEVMDDPPSRQYLISRESGIDLLLDDGCVVAVQIFVQATRKFSAFSGELPLGLKNGMSQEDVHQMLGKPIGSDIYDSRYNIFASNAKLIVTFDESSKIKYMSLETT